MGRKLLAALLLLLLMQSALALTNIFYNGDLRIKLDRNEFSPGGLLEAEIEAANFEQFPIAEGYLVIELVSSKSIPYPTQFSDEGVIFYEKVIENVNLPARHKKKFDFSYMLPKDLREGDYAINAYFRTKITPIVGVPSIMMNPKSAFFSITKSAGEFPGLNIVRTRTVFNNTLGPVGAFVEAGGLLEGKVFVENTSSKDLSNLELFAGLCEWDDSSCSSFEAEQTKQVARIAAGETAELEISLEAPQEAGAYAIRIEVREKGGRLLSLYRNRAIVEGATAGIRKLTVNKPGFGAGEEITLDVLVGPSPDHKNYPDFEDFELSVWVEDLEGKSKTQGSVFIPLIRSRIAEFIEKRFSLAAPAKLDDFRFCAKITKGTKLHDEHCYTIHAAEFAIEEEQEYALSVDLIYDAASSQLEMVFCGSIGSTVADVNGNYYIIDKNINQLISEGSFFGKECERKKISLAAGEYSLLVNDFIGRKQLNFKLSPTAQLEITPKLKPKKSCAELGGVICAEGEMCAAQFIDAAEAKGCCPVPCTAAGAARKPFDIAGTFMLVSAGFLVALLVIIIAGAVKRRIKREGEDTGF